MTEFQKSGLECDAVVHLRNGSYGLVEIKLGGEKPINEGAENLIKLPNRIDTTKMKSPSFEMVLILSVKSHFSKVFTTVTGMSPTTYRKLHNKPLTENSDPNIDNSKNREAPPPSLLRKIIETTVSETVVSI